METQIGHGDTVLALGMRGRVLSVRADDVIIRFDPPYDLELKLRRDQVRVLKSSDVNIVSGDQIREQAVVKSSAVARDVVALRHDVEALRFGLVPSNSLSRITIGYADMRRWALSRLPREGQDQPTFSEVRGAFGNGKTHALSVVRHVAMERGFLTAHVEVDGTRVTLGDPSSLLCAIWSSLHGSNGRSSTPLFDLYETCIKNGHQAVSVAPAGIDRVQRAYAVIRQLVSYDTTSSCRAVVDALLCSDSSYNATKVNQLLRTVQVPGYPLQMNPMIGIRVDERPYDFIESLIGHTLLAKTCGYAGLALTIDEFEVERTYAWRWSRVEALLNVLIKYFNRELRHPSAPIAIFVATVGETGDGTDASLDRVVAAVDGDIHDVEPLAEYHIEELSQRVIALYNEAYGPIRANAADVAPEVRSRLHPNDREESGFTRALIKTIVAQLDLLNDPAARYVRN